VKKEKKDANAVFSKGVPLNLWGKVITDPFGSYTGNPLEKGEQPVQDADDL